MDRAEIEAKARALGFDHLGVCAVDPLPPEMDRFRDWLARGFHGEMKWIERAAAERLDPSLLFRDARSILVGAIRYAAQPAPSRAPLAGEVSSYAWGDDYHRIVGEKAGRLAAFLRERYDARAAEYVDTGPVLERLWAARAGERASSAATSVRRSAPGTGARDRPHYPRSCRVRGSGDSISLVSSR